MSDLRRRRRGRQRRASRRRTNLLLIIGGMFAAMLGGVVLVSAYAVHTVAQDLNLEDGGLPEIRLGQNTRIYDKDNKPPRDHRRRDQPHRGRAASRSRRS